MNCDEAPEFAKDIKSLRKRVPTILSDIERVKPQLESLYVQPEGLDDEQWTEYRRNFFDNKRAAKLKGYRADVDVIKLRVDTDTQQYRNKLRLVCVAVSDGATITLVELYAKNDKELQDPRRLKGYLP